VNVITKRKALEIILIVLNIIEIVILVLFAIPYITYNTKIVDPNAMLPFEAWDRAGMILTLGFVPLLAINIFSFIFIKFKEKYWGFLFFIPSIICFIIVLSYWIN